MAESIQNILEKEMLQATSIFYKAAEDYTKSIEASMLKYQKALSEALLAAENNLKNVLIRDPESPTDQVFSCQVDFKVKKK